MNNLVEVLKAVNHGVIDLAGRKSYLMYEQPADVDRHDNNLEEIEKDITLLREFRIRLEERISS